MSSAQMDTSMQRRDAQDAEPHMKAHAPGRLHREPTTPPDPPAPQQALAQLIEGEIIPRLMMAHRSQPSPSTPILMAQTRFSGSDIDQLCLLLTAPEPDRALQHILRLSAEGAAHEAIFLELLGPAARRLGRMWEDDECSFTDVTLGLSRLQQAVHELGAHADARHSAPDMPLTQAPVATPRAERSILLAPAPGEQHTFGIVMLSEFFRRAGWSTWCEYDARRADLCGLVRRKAFAVAGLTVGCDAYLDQIPPLISAVRQASANPSIAILVGGRPIAERPGLASALGADATAADARAAVAVAEGFVREGAHAV